MKLLEKIPLPKKKWIPIIVSLVAIILIVVGVILARGSASLNFSSALSYQDYQVVLEVKMKDEVIVTGVYAHQSLSDITYFRLIGLDEDLEQEYYDGKNKKLYYQNTTTGMYQEMDYETDYSMQRFLEKTLLDSDGIERRSHGKYLVSSSVISDLYENSDDLVMSYLKEQGYLPSGEPGEAVVQYSNNYFDVITYTIPTKKGDITMEFTFQTEPRDITLPVQKSDMEDEKLAAQWIILFIQRIYANEGQEVKAITDINYFLESSYKDELIPKLKVKPVEVRLRINPSTSKESGIISGTITFENGTTITIEKNNIVE